ncbi:MAG TPA: ATP-binding cassette domain-containing protein, partial [Anaerovoracaceae bacterium]|nr:ATP-binding cassette domain-containing protein [Anaerovoracaceae bacterium]
MTEEIIRMEELSKVYDTGEIQVAALKCIDLTIHKGEFIAIMGASGSGKSTLMNIIGCLDRPTEGRYYLEGIDVAEKSDNELSAVRNQQIGFVFQSFNLISRTSALKNVELPMVYGKVSSEERKERALELLKNVGLEDRAHHMPNELSGG